jgi:hypothetical protein
MKFSFVQDHTNLKYSHPWEELFPYCNHCGTMTSNRKGVCTGCLTGVPWDLTRTTRLTNIILDDMEQFLCTDQ